MNNAYLLDLGRWVSFGTSGDVLYPRSTYAGLEAMGVCKGSSGDWLGGVGGVEGFSEGENVGSAYLGDPVPKFLFSAFLEASFSSSLKKLLYLF